MQFLPTELCTAILLLAGPPTSASFILVSKRFYEIALVALLRHVALNKGPQHTISFISWLLSEQGLRSLHHLRHLSIHPETLCVPGTEVHLSAWGHAQPNLSATHLLKRLLFRLTKMPSLHSLHFHYAPNVLLRWPAFAEALTQRVSVLTVDFMTIFHLRFSNISSLAVTSLQHNIRSLIESSEDMILPHLSELSAPLEIVELFSRFHALQSITLRHDLYHYGRPSWIKNYDHVARLSRVLRRLTIKSITLGVETSDERIIDDLLMMFSEDAPTLESLALCLACTTPFTSLRRENVVSN